MKVSAILHVSMVTARIHALSLESTPLNLLIQDLLIQNLLIQTTFVKQRMALTAQSLLHLEAIWIGI
jgi:hypothetical protein